MGKEKKEEGGGEENKRKYPMLQKKKIKTSHNECKMQYSPSPPMPL